MGRIAIAVSLLAGVMLSAPTRVSGSLSTSITFHHLHLNDSAPSKLLTFYERLFDPSLTRRRRVLATDGLQSGPMLLLIGTANGSKEMASGLWHFGWGSVSLGETYVAHAAKEVTWEPPLAPGQLHLHLRSVTPSAAAEWYRDTLGLRVEIVPPQHDVRAALPPPEHRMPEALVWIGETGLLIYRTEPPLFSSRGQRVDHLALGCPNLEATLNNLRARRVNILVDVRDEGGERTAMIEGPDRVAIELVEIE
jgi:hypothetical protein